MKKTLWILVLLFFTSQALGYLDHEQIVKRLTSEQGETTKKKGRVLYQPLDKVLKRKKRKKAKHEQKWARRRYPTTIATLTPNPVRPISPSMGSGADLRTRDTSIKSQIGPYCTAYGLAAGVENLLGDRISLSPAHVWSFYRRYSVEAAAKAVPGNLLTLEALWPTVGSKPKPNYLSEAKRTLTKIVEIDHESVDDDLNAVKMALDHSHPVYVGLSVPSDMSSCFPTIRPETSITSGGHAVLIVGYKLDRRINGGGYLIIKNSWGTDCGDQGYQYMAFSVCAKNRMYCYFYEVAEASKI